MNVRQLLGVSRNPFYAHTTLYPLIAYHQAIIKIKDGRLFPSRLIKLIWNLKGPGRKRTVNRFRIPVLCVKKEYHRAGIGPLLYAEFLKIGPSLGYKIGEASFIIEDNLLMNRSLIAMRAKRSKTHRIYERLV